ncbi:MAG: hypothetical protein WBC44_03950 [Planctomycetaceae bacterium]
MPAGVLRCADRRSANTTNWLAVTALLGVTGLVAVFAPAGQGRVKPGDLVSYSEDRIGRPWTIVREHEFGRYVIRNGLVRAIADPDEIAPYAGFSKNVTVQMAGVCWQDKVREIRRSQRQEVAAKAPF